MQEKRPLVWLSAVYPTFFTREALLGTWQPEHHALPRATPGVCPPGSLDNATGRIGVFDTSDLSADQLSELPGTLACFAVEHWVAVVAPHQVYNPTVCRLINRHCTDYHTRPVQPARLDAVLGHLWGMSQLQARLSGDRTGWCERWRSSASRTTRCAPGTGRSR